jgi:hypothetical protein
MKHKDLLLGLLLAAALAAGVFLARGGEPPPPPAAQARTTPPTDAPPPADASPPDITAAEVRASLGGLVVRVDVPARPILAYVDNVYRFRFERAGQGGQPLSLDGGQVSFTMKMNMGHHVYRLVPAPDAGWYQVTAALPVCASGGRRWFGDLGFEIEGEAHALRYAFDLEPMPKPD